MAKKGIKGSLELAGNVRKAVREDRDFAATNVSLRWLAVRNIQNKLFPHPFAPLFKPLGVRKGIVDNGHRRRDLYSLASVIP
jgi:hypothetical protein